MDASAVVLLITSILTALILGVLVATTVSMLSVSRQIHRRLDQLDENLSELVQVMASLSESSKSELENLNRTLQEQQRVHQSIRKTTKLIDIVFKKPAVTTAAITQTTSKGLSRRKARKSKKNKEMAK